jgi:glycosyltransferase involved in cell wall biosynthesis
MADRSDITVITALYNCEQYIADCVRSVQAQTLPPREHIIVDDCSTDGGYGLVQRLAAQYTRVPLRVLQTDHNSGPSAARNAGIRVASGAFIAVLDSDDIAFSDWLLTAAPVIEAEPAVGAVGGGALVITEEGLPTGAEEACLWRGDRTNAAQMHDAFPVMHSGCLLRRSAVESIGAYHEGLWSKEDSDLLIGMAFHSRIVHVGRPLIYRRRCRSSASDQPAPYVRATHEYLAAKRALLTRGLSPHETREQLQPAMELISSLPRGGDLEPGVYEYRLGLECLRGKQARRASEYLRKAASLGYRHWRASSLAQLASGPAGPLLGTLVRMWQHTNIRARSAARHALARLGNPR